MSKKDDLLKQIKKNAESAERQEEFKKKYQKDFGPKPKAIRKYEKYSNMGSKNKKKSENDSE